MHQELSIYTLNRILKCLHAVRNGPALYALLATFSMAGLLLATAESSLARADTLSGALWAGAALTFAFYGVNTTGLLLMDQALGRPVRDVQDAFGDALRCGHRVLLTLGVVVAIAALCLGGVVALLSLVPLPGLGPWLFGVLVPLGVLLLGTLSVSVALLTGPLTGPSVWAGQGVRQTLRLLWRQWRLGLLDVLLLMGAVLVLTALVSAVVTFVVVAGGRALAMLAVWVVGIDLPPQQLMAGLFGYGLRSLGAAGAPVAGSPLGVAAVIGGGAVFALALVLPGLVYLSGCCQVFLSLRELPDQDRAHPESSR